MLSSVEHPEENLVPGTSLEGTFFLTWKQDTPKPCSKHRSSSFNQQFPHFLSQTNFFPPVFIRKLFSLKGRAAETKTGNSTPQSVDPCLVLLFLQLFAADRFCGHFQHQETSLARVPAWSLSLSSNDLIVKSQMCRDWWIFLQFNLNQKQPQNRRFY